MHEMGIMSAMLKTLDRILEQEQATEVHKIVLEIGELSGVVPRFIEDCYEAVVDGTRYASTELEIEVVPGEVRCEDCGEEFNAAQYDLKCPQCGGQCLTPLGGTDFFIKEIEIA